MKIETRRGRRLHVDDKIAVLPLDISHRKYIELQVYKRLFDSFYVQLLLTPTEGNVQEIKDEALNVRLDIEELDHTWIEDARINELGDSALAAVAWVESIILGTGESEEEDPT